MILRLTPPSRCDILGKRRRWRDDLIFRKHFESRGALLQVKKALVYPSCVSYCPFTGTSLVKSLHIQVFAMLASFALLALSAYQVFAFPSYLSDAFPHDRSGDPAHVDSPCPHMVELAKRAITKGSEIANRQAPGTIPPFNAAEQYVSNQGQYEFVAPGPTDQRGPCKSLPVEVKLKRSHIES